MYMCAMSESLWQDCTHTQTCKCMWTYMCEYIHTYLAFLRQCQIQNSGQWIPMMGRQDEIKEDVSRSMLLVMSSFLF